MWRFTKLSTVTTLLINTVKFTYCYLHSVCTNFTDAEGSNITYIVWDIENILQALISESVFAAVDEDLKRTKWVDCNPLYKSLLRRVIVLHGKHWCNVCSDLSFDFFQTD